MSSVDNKYTSLTCQMLGIEETDSLIAKNGFEHFIKEDEKCVLIMGLNPAGDEKDVDFEKSENYFHLRYIDDEKLVNKIKKQEVDMATIGTIHSVAMTFLEKYWYLLGFSPKINVLSDEDKDFFLSQSLNSILSDDDVAFLSDVAETLVIPVPGNNKGFYKEFWKEQVKSIVENAIRRKLMKNFKVCHSLNASLQSLSSEMKR